MENGDCPHRIIIATCESATATDCSMPGGRQGGQQGAEDNRIGVLDAQLTGRRYRCLGKCVDQAHTGIRGGGGGERHANGRIAGAACIARSTRILSALVAGGILLLGCSRID